MTKPGVVRQKEYEHQKKGEDKEAYLQNNVIKKENKEKYSKLRRRNMKLKSLRIE